MCVCAAEDGRLGEARGRGGRLRQHLPGRGERTGGSGWGCSSVQTHLLSFQLKKDQVDVHSLTLEEEIPVRNLKPAAVKVYDYYQTSE